MKILIIGNGAVGRVMADILSKERFVSRLLVGTLNPKAKNQVKVDASQAAQVSQAGKGMDLIINASLPNFNEVILKAALKVRANYQDLCSHLVDLVHAEQLQFHDDFVKAGRVGLIDTGVSPGITNILARAAADEMDSVQSIRIRLLEDQEGEHRASWSPEVTRDEMTARPLVYARGRTRFSKPLADRELYDFNAKIGKKPVYSLYGDEVSTLPIYLDVENVDYKCGGSDIEAARRGNRKQGKMPTPAEMISLVKSGKLKRAQLVLAVETEGMKTGKRHVVQYVAVCPDIKEITKRSPGSTYVSYPTALAAAAFARTIPHLKKIRGVFPPEVLGKAMRKQVLDDVRKGGVKITRRVVE